MCVDGAALLTGYGGMHVPSTPRYNPSLITWCEAGGRAAVANLRGGCELGEEWHLAGRRDRKENVFQDFAAVAEFLVAHGNADRGKVVIHGRSNGGLLVGDAVVRNPELFAAAACGVPLLDMLR
ncbi:Peptidase S9, prolyl oligopeptidase active site region domain protein, partial [mine drainage metagenome]